MKKPMNQNELEERLEKEIVQLRSVPERDPEAAARGKAFFLAEAESLQATVSPKPFQRLNEWLQISFIGLRKERSPMFGTISAVIMALALVFGGGGATVYAAQGSMPDELLYPVKLFSEDAQLHFTGDLINQAQLLEQFIHRRFDEIDGLVMAGEGIPPDVANRLQLQIETQLQLAAGMNDEEMQQTLARLQETIQTRTQKMTMSGQPDHADPQLEQIRNMLQERLRLVQTGLEEPNKLRLQFGLLENQPTEPPQGPPEDSNGQNNGGNPEQPGPGPCEDCEPAGEGSGVGEGSQGPKGSPQPEGNGPGGPNEEPGGDGKGQQGAPSDTPAQNGSGSEDSGPKPTEEPPEDKGEQNGSENKPDDAGGSGDGSDKPPEPQEPPDGNGSNGANSFAGGVGGNGEGGGDGAGENGGGGKP